MKKFKSTEKIDETEFFRLGLKETLHWKKKKTLNPLWKIDESTKRI